MSIITGHVHKKNGRDAALGVPVRWKMYNISAADTAGIVAAEDPNSGTAGVAKELTLAATTLDPPRPLVYEVTVDADADVRVTFRTYGTDTAGNAAAEVIGPVTLAGGAVEGRVPFKTVSKCTATMSVVTDAADRVTVGWDGARVSPPIRLKMYSDILALRLADGAPLTRVASAPGAGQFEFIEPESTVAGEDPISSWALIRFGDAFNGTNDYTFELQSTYGVRYE